MKKQFFLVFGLAIILICLSGKSFAEKKDKLSDKPVYAIVGGQEQLTPFPADERTKKILLRNEIQNQARRLAEGGLYDEAISKFREAMDSSLLNEEIDKGMSIQGIVRSYERQGKFEEALREYRWYVDQNKTNDAAKEGQKELLALLESQKTGSPKPIYNHIAYLKKKYKKYIPPQSKGDSGFHSIPINDIIHLYNYMGDADGGIKFMNEVLSSKSLYPAERKEYERVKQAFKEDKRTGQKGHLQQVIETSDYIV